MIVMMCGLFSGCEGRPISYTRIHTDPTYVCNSTFMYEKCIDKFFMLYEFELQGTAQNHLEFEFEQFFLSTYGILIEE